MSEYRDSYHTIGAQQDRARLFALLTRIAVALEAIASQEKEKD